jgi:hypothetical protein
MSKHIEGVKPAVCTATRKQDGSWAITVPECPLCGKTHYHGGGNAALPSLGHRVAHCQGDGYVLVSGGKHDHTR